MCTPTSAHTPCGTAARRTVCHPGRQGGRAAAAGHPACASGTPRELAAVLSALCRPFQDLQWMAQPISVRQAMEALVTGPAKALVRTGDLMSRRCSPSLFSQAGVSSAVHDLRRQQRPVPQLPGSVRRRSRRPQPAVRPWQRLAGCSFALYTCCHAALAPGPACVCYHSCRKPSTCLMARAGRTTVRAPTRRPRTTSRR